MSRLGCSLLGPQTLTCAKQLGETPTGIEKAAVGESRIAQAVGGGHTDDDDLQARLDSLRR